MYSKAKNCSRYFRMDPNVDRMQDYDKSKLQTKKGSAETATRSKYKNQ